MERIYPGSLHNHSEYSNIKFRDSTNKLDKLFDKALDLGHKVMALTDHDCISGYIKAEKLYQKAKEKDPDFKLILGNEIYLCRNGLNLENFEKGKDKYYHHIILAKDIIGNQQIRELSTRAWMRSYMDQGIRRVPTYYSDLEEIVGKNPGHVIGSSACLGSALGTQLLMYREDNNEDRLKQIYNWIEYMRQIYGDNNFYLEMQPSIYDEQKFVNNYIKKFSEELKIPYIITTD